MRQKKYVLIDDIDGTEAADTITFALGRQAYEIELNERHIAELRADFEKWIAKARKVGNRRGRSTASGTTISNAAKIRKWALQRGIELSDRGRIPMEIREQYQRETGDV